MSVSDRGQVMPLVALLIVVAGTAGLLVARLGGAAVSRARAQTAADAAALAGAVDGRSGALALARANGGRLLVYEPVGTDVRVVVAVGVATARARARPVGAGDAGAAILPPGGRR